MDDILKEAIADAKALRATALENAKIALEEAFTPRLKNMLSQKIQSEVENEDEVEEDAYSEEEVEDGHEEMSAEDEITGDEEVAEQDMEVAPEMSDEDEEAELSDEDDEVVPAELSDEDDEVVPAELSDEEGEDDVIEVNGIKYAPVVSEDDEVAPEMSDEDDEVPAELSDEDEDELDLESVIKELEEELDTSAVGDAENKEPSDSASDSSEVGQGSEEPSDASDESEGSENDDDTVVKEPVTESEEAEEMSDEDEEIDLDEVIKALDEEEADDEGESVDELNKRLKEYQSTVGYLREKLNEVNLMNAKLLFTNKLFRGFGLNNNQKLRVIEQFDRTKNLREIKLVYATLAESFQGKDKPRVNESKGQASKTVQSTAPKKEVLSEGAQMRNRFKKLANLI